MKILILGGGLTGLTAAHYLSQTNNKVIILEKGEKLGGLAGGFKLPHWEWELERTYHHIFKNDMAILSLSHEIGQDNFEFKIPLTASLFGEKNNYRIYPVDSPKDFLLLPELSLLSKMRAGATLLFLKITPHLSWFEKISSSQLLKRTMGGEVWNKLWEQLFKKKFGKYAEKILSSFIWARIHKRTQELGYPRGGFQAFVEALAEVDKKNSVSIITSSNVQKVRKDGEKYKVETINKEKIGESYEADIIISTLPYPITCIVMKEVVGASYVKEQGKRKYLSAVNLILKTTTPILKDTYWLNVGAHDIPIMCIVQHTNFISQKKYGGDNICYVAWYVEEGSELLKKTEKQMVDFVLPHLKEIAPHLVETPEVVGLFRAPYAQPIFDKEFVEIPRLFSTPAKNIFVANMDMTFPFDRGTNYAVQLGKDVSNFILKSL